MQLLELLSQATEQHIIHGKPKNTKLLQPQQIRFFNGKLYSCEADGYPIEGFLYSEFLTDYEWEKKDLPEYTLVSFKQAHAWLYNKKPVKLNVAKKEYIFLWHENEVICSVPGFTFGWDDILYGEWYIKNR